MSGLSSYLNVGLKTTTNFLNQAVDTIANVIEEVVKEEDQNNPSATKFNEPEVTPTSKSKYSVDEGVIEFVNALADHDDTFISFPLKDGIDTFEMNKQQENHARAILAASSSFARQRYRLCPSSISDAEFWRVYFILFQNFQRHRSKSQGSADPTLSDISTSSSSSSLSSSSTFQFFDISSLLDRSATLSSVNHLDFNSDDEEDHHHHHHRTFKSSSSSASSSPSRDAYFSSTTTTTISSSSDDDHAYVAAHGLPVNDAEIANVLSAPVNHDENDDDDDLDLDKFGSSPASPQLSPLKSTSSSSHSKSSSHSHSIPSPTISTPSSLALTQSSSIEPPPKQRGPSLGETEISNEEDLP